VVIGGRIRLEQVLVIILQNAIEATGAQDDPQIDVTLEIADDIVRLVVKDNGPGIAPEMADRIFTPFATSRQTGLGLGLVIAQDIMTDLGGALRFVPSTKGACFVVEMKRAP
jgi:two-component system C4-dicarboxylate transport sensor histidine kinase DctB